MIIDSFDSDKQVLVIAEIGNNHEGNYTLAEEMVGLAAQAGVGAVKFQTIKTEHLTSRKDEARFNRLKSFELTENEFERLAAVAREAGVLFLSTPFDVESVRSLNNLTPAFKIASGDNNFFPMIDVIARTGKPIFLSSGLADIKQIKTTTDFIQNIWRECGINQELAVLHCVASYPTPPQEANLLAIRQLRNQLGVTVGYSDHTLGIEAAVLSAALGARIIEKHFTLDKNYSDFRDHQLSADPQDMSSLVQRIKDISVLLGTGNKLPQASEKAIESAIRRSIVAKHDLPKDARLSWDDITWIRPADGLPPGKEDLVLGKFLSKSIEMGELIVPEILYEKGNT